MMGVLRGGRYVGNTLLPSLLVQEPDVVLSRFALLRRHVPLLRRPPIVRLMDERWAIDGKFSVPYDPGARFRLRLNQSFSLFLKASSTVPL
jgi:hypothetical protein